ncbi:MAG TPA: hypothetical protein V6D15_22120 [Oculatellaceae cyanobacterium]
MNNFTPKLEVMKIYAVNLGERSPLITASVMGVYKCKADTMGKIIVL